jgi:hypothetical protein
VLALAGLVALAAGLPLAAGARVSEPSDRPVARALAAPTGTVAIRVSFDAAGRGSFVARGAISDAGPATTGRSLSGRRIRLTQTLEGSYGTLVIRVEQACGSRRSTWRTLRGSGSYEGMSGGGSGTGGVPCSGRRQGFRGIYRGTVRSPALRPLATPGPYGGWTAQNERLTFEVLADGRRVSDIRIERLYAPCTPPLDVTVEPAFRATYPIAPDGSFSATFGASTITGRFNAAAATGTVTYSSSATGPYVCTSGSVSWSASSPPPPLPSALPGSYCGSTAQDLGICLTLSSQSRLTHARAEVRLDCVLAFDDGARVPPERAERARFGATLGFGAGSVPLRSNLSFQVLGPLEGDAGGEYVLRGAFDEAGGASGTLSLHRTSFDDQEGRVYTCLDALLGWRATRVG